MPAGRGTPTPEELAGGSAIANPEGRVPGFGAWLGPTKNALDMEVNPMGHQVDYRQFRNMIPTAQEMKLGEVESVRGKFGVNDFIKEMDAYRPKGEASGSVGLG